jgi:hypothetical protein
MFRKIVSIALTVSFIGVASSGLLMLFVNGFAFQIRMHPVHNVFSVIMVISGATHLYLNFKPLKAYLRAKPVLIVGIVLTILLVLAYFAGIFRQLDPNIVERLNELSAEVNN